MIPDATMQNHSKSRDQLLAEIQALRARVSALEEQARQVSDSALRESEQKFSRIFHLNPLAMSITRLSDGLFLDVNEGYCRLFGYSREELLSRTAIKDLNLWPNPEERHLLVEQVKENGEVSDFEARMRYRDGSIKDCSLSVRRIELQGEDGIIAIIRDITEENALEDALIQARITAEETSRAKSEFLANISHEIRTPMTVFMGMLDLALGTRLDPTQREYLNAAQSASQSLLRLIEDILDFSRIETGHLKLRRASVALSELAGEVVALFRHRALQKGITLDLNLDPQVPARIQTDEQRLRQVLINLIDNALKFTARGRIALDIAPGENDRVRITVSDTGIGIPEEKVGQLFRIFSQVDSSSTRRYGGTGLGLALCRRLVEMMGGSIGVESRFNEGSRFYIDLPTDLQDTAQHHLSRRTASEHPSPTEVAHVEDVEILLVEDDLMIQRVMRMMLEKKGWKVVTVDDGEAALNALKTAHFDIVFMDVQMPRLDGLETSRSIRAKEKNGEHIPIVALTAHSLAEDRRECLQAGMDDYLTKPVEPDLLYAMVEKCLAAGDAHPRRD